MTMVQKPPMTSSWKTCLADSRELGPGIRTFPRREFCFPFTKYVFHLPTGSKGFMFQSSFRTRTTAAQLLACFTTDRLSMGQPGLPDRTFLGAGDVTTYPGQYIRYASFSAFAPPTMLAAIYSKVISYILRTVSLCPRSQGRTP